MTITKVFPVANQCVISVPRLKGHVFSKGIDHGQQVVFQRGAMLPLGFALQVTFELPELFNFPHG
ncbi:hypothetical protein ADT32_01175 [Xylella fastidiosa]|nr:hypothetical protein BC375_04240 [Xylella fastidiosa]KXB10562.1 hypothetical protein ADT33_11125 [Xylella fastidiosa]KXB13155.1 hypothetical protein ADT32_01175 [Xylella fastidiosa]